MTFIYYYSKPLVKCPLPGEALSPLLLKITNNSEPLGTPHPDSHLSSLPQRVPTLDTLPPEAGFVSAPSLRQPQSAARAGCAVPVG